MEDTAHYGPIPHRTFRKFSDEEMTVQTQLALQRANEILQMEARLKSITDLLESRKNNLAEILGNVKEGGVWV